MHAYMSMFAISSFVCLFCVSVSCLDCEVEPSYFCDCCECAGCDQGKWHTYSHYFTICISVFYSVHDSCFQSKVMLCLEFLVVCSHPKHPLLGWLLLWKMMPMLVHFWLRSCFGVKNYNLNETPGWIWLCLVYVEWLLRTACMVDLTIVCGGCHLRVHLWMATQETKRLPCLPCFSELPVQPYDIMGSVLIN